MTDGEDSQSSLIKFFSMKTISCFGGFSIIFYFYFLDQMTDQVINERHCIASVWSFPMARHQISQLASALKETVRADAQREAAIKVESYKATAYRESSEYHIPASCLIVSWQQKQAVLSA